MFLNVSDNLISHRFITKIRFCPIQFQSQYHVINSDNMVQIRNTKIYNIKI